ncbi:MAG: VOC family protein [Candidatus Melainabacteria bacterium]|nr:VOC family protein [Candidatus Melainabacteria bacterium]
MEIGKVKAVKIWANLGVDDLERTFDFYTGLGFESNMSRPSDALTSLRFGKDGFVINFFKKDKLKWAMNGDIANLGQGNEVMFSLSAETKEEIAAWADQAERLGGRVFRPASYDEDGYYYCGFADPDGHMFNVLLM